MNKNEDILFCLGGYDLEMVEIKKLFSANTIDFLDAGLSWGVSSIDYQKKPYCTQTTKAVTIRKTIIVIESADFPSKKAQFLYNDHHYERKDKPKAAEWVGCRALILQFDRPFFEKGATNI